MTTKEGYKETLKVRNPTKTLTTRTCLHLCKVQELTNFMNKETNCLKK